MPYMIEKASKEQKDLILNARRSFNLNQRRMAEAYGFNGRTPMIGNASTLPKDVWGEWDKEGLEVQRDVLAVYNDLVSVSRNIPLGKLMHYFQQISDSSTVNVSMDGRSKAPNDQQEYAYVGTPVPIVDSPFGYGWRQMLAAQTEGVSLDTAGRSNANRKVAETLEDIVLNGNSQIVVAGAQLYGLRNHPQRNTRSTGVTLNAATGAQWVSEFTATKKLLHGDNYRAPATFYVNWDDWYYAGSTEYIANYPKKIAAAVLEIEGIASVVPSSKVPANNIIAVVKNKSAIELLNGMPMMTRAQARQNPEDDYNFVVMACAALEIKYDANNQCGVAHSS